MPHGAVLTDFVEAVLSDDADKLVAARHAVRQSLGDAALVDICATVASFNAVVKIADGTGIPLEAVKEARTRDLREELGVDEFRR